MKQDSHPAHGPLAYRDRATGDVVPTRSVLVDSEGRVERFERRYGRSGPRGGAR